MGTNSTFSVFVSGILLGFMGFLSSSHGHYHANQQTTPHRCDVDSSEECHHWRSSKLPILRAKTSSISVRFNLHKNIHNPDESVELLPNDIDSIRNALPYSNNSTWKIIIPAFPSNGKSPFPNNVRDAYMKSMLENPEKQYNILIIDWDRDKMCNLDTKITDNNLTYTGVVGEKVAEMLIFLNDNNFLTLSENVHVIGFSVGAHVAGETARFVFRKYSKQNMIYRMTALDPSSWRFWQEPKIPSPMDRVPRIRRSFVAFLDVYHTTMAYGMKTRLGDIDFFLNGKGYGWQPGCYRGDSPIFGRQYSKIDDFTALCSHVYSTEIFAKSINDRTMKGCTGCDEYEIFKNERCKCEDYPILGESVDDELYMGYPKASGVAFINTEGFSSFGEEFEKRLVDAGEPQHGHERWHQLC